MDLDLKLLAEARNRRDEARRLMLARRAEAEALADEYHRLDEAVATLEQIKGEQAQFTHDARELLG
jgi:hypothetical protein